MVNGKHVVYGVNTVLTSQEDGDFPRVESLLAGELPEDDTAFSTEMPSGQAV